MNGVHLYTLIEFVIWDPGFESCIQQRMPTCLLSIQISFACARASTLTTTNIYITRARCESQLAVGLSDLNICWSEGQAVKFKFLAWSLKAQSACQWAFSLLVIWCLGYWVWILHSADEPAFDSIWFDNTWIQRFKQRQLQDKMIIFQVLG